MSRIELTDKEKLENIQRLFFKELSKKDSWKPIEIENLYQQCVLNVLLNGIL